MAFPSLDDIKQRKLVQWGLAYLGGAWLVLQVVSVLSGAYSWPAFLMRAAPIVLAVGFLVALVVAWYHGEKGAQRVSGPELAILTGLLVLGGLGVMLIGGGADAAPEGGETESAVATLVDPEVEQTAIAVLPFETIGGDEIFAAGLTDALHQTLSRVPSLQVTAKTSSGIFRQASVSADSIGRALKVAHLVEGSVRDIGEGRVRIAARLVNAETGRQDWTETYDRDVEDVFAVQEEIARAVAFELRAEVGSAAMIGQMPSNTEVYSLMVRARQLIEGGGDLETTTQEVMRLSEEAIALDSTYAPAWGYLALSRGALAQYLSSDTEGALAAAAAERALALDPNEWGAHIFFGVQTMISDPGTAKNHFERATAALPADAATLGYLAFTLLQLGDEAGAIRMAERVATLDPFSADGLHTAAYIHSAAGRHQRAVELGRAMFTLRPEHPGSIAQFASILAVAGHAEESIELAQRAVDMDPRFEWARLTLARAHAHAGNRAEAEQLLSTISADKRHYKRGGIEAALGDPDAAFAAIERSIAEEAREHWGEIPTDHNLRSLHDDPRWEPLVARVRAGAAESRP